MAAETSEADGSTAGEGAEARPIKHRFPEPQMICSGSPLTKRAHQGGGGRWQPGYRANVTKASKLEEPAVMQCRRAMVSLLVMVPLFAGKAQTQTAPALVYTHALPASAIASVQQRLQQAGVYNGRPDGVWGPESQAALERFQQTRNLQVTGQLNQATVATLGMPPSEVLVGGAAPAPAQSATSPTPTSAEPLSPAVIRNVQQRLRALGFYRGSSDGVWGAGTQAAIERFQQGRGLQSTGQINPATIQALGLDLTNPAVRTR